MKKVTLSFAALLMATTMYGAAGPKPTKAVDQFVSGQLGSLGVKSGFSMMSRSDDREMWSTAARDFARSKTLVLGGAGTEDFSTRSVQRDDIGQVHVRLNQSIAGLRVVGGELIVHADAATGEVMTLNGRFLPDHDLPRQVRLGAGAAIDRAIANMKVDAQVIGSPELVYAIDEHGVASLAWSNTITYEGAEGTEIDVIFADAANGRLVARQPQIHRARSRNTYNGNNGTLLPGTLILTETTGSSTDSVINNAHTHAGNTYDYFKNTHARDSYDGAGATIKSTVHHKVSYNNAFWNGTQMVYGDGDGSQFGPLGNAVDVVGHEITHAVTERTAALVYANESGALNEAMSDVFGAMVERYKVGTVGSNTWRIGEACYTPTGSTTDALRYMNNPTADGSSKDYYPERYVGTSDNGGVHWNSGIANLAFYLLSQGGSHPRSKTTTVVTSVGYAAAEKIFYRALTVYMTSSTNFSGARTASLNAARDLYGSTSTQYTQTGNAWTAVGVGGAAPPPACTTINGSLSGTGAYQYEPLIGANRYYYSSTSGTHTGKLTGTGPDFDLYLQKWNGASWAQVAASESATSTENITYSGTAGYYRYKVLSYSGSGTYSLCYSKPS